MADPTKFDLILIGGGPGGYVGAIRAAQLGMKVACVERDKLGGVCLNWGCIPTKALLAGAELYHKLTHDAEGWGILAKDVSYDWEKVIGRSRKVAGNLNKGVHALFKKNKIEHFEGHAFIPEAGTVQVYDHKDVETDPKRPAIDQDMPAEVRFNAKPKQTLSAKHIIIATGAAPRALPGAAFDGETIISSKEAMVLPEKPESLLIVGSGAIGMEFAYFYNAFGTQVTVVEMLDRVLPVEDHEVSKAAQKAFKKQGIKMITGHTVKSIEKTDRGVKATIAPAEGAQLKGGGYGSAGQNAKAKGDGDTLEAEKVLVAIGVRGRFDGLFEDKLGIELVKGHIKTDYREPGTKYQTSVEGIYAIGDVIGPPWLAHVASEEAIVCVERIAGHEAPDIDYDSIPGCTYCQPQVASIGYTEQRCKEEGIDYVAGTFPFQASGKAQALGETAGFVKLITGKQHGEVLGAHMIGEGVTELIAEMGLARRLEATAEEVIATIHAHPTMSEAVHEAALGADGRMIHY